MSLNETRQANLKLLDKLKGNESVGIDSAGRLYVVQQGAFLSATQAFFSRAGSDIEKVGLDYAEAKFNELDFQDVTHNQSQYLNLQKKLIALGISSKASAAIIARNWYAKRIDYLVASGLSRPEATAIATCELWHDPYAPEDLKRVVAPEPTKGGTSGSYFIKNLNGQKIGVFKPQDEEIYMPNNPRGYAQPISTFRFGPKQGHAQGCSWLKEIAAWEIDQGQFAGVPKTVEIDLLFPETPTSKNIISKKGSFQLFSQGVPVAELRRTEIEAIPTNEVQNKALFDLAVGNADRNMGNMLYNKQTQKLIPIDHGLTLLDSIDWLGNPGISETSCQWFAWPQISLPVNDEGKNWVLGYDIDANCQKMRMRGISAGSIREHKLRMTFLKVTIQKGYNLQEIGSMCMQTKETKEAVTFLDKKVMQTAAPMSDAERTNETVFLATFRQILETEL